MKKPYLKLTNTPECLKLAECLIGSRCESGMIKGGELLGVNKMFALTYDSGAIYSYWRGEIILPLDSLKLNPFKCLEHKINIEGLEKTVLGNVYTRRVGFIKSLGGLLPDTSMLCMVSSPYGGSRILYECKLDEITLDLENLPTGAEIVEIDND